MKAKVHFLGQGGFDLLCCLVRDHNERPNQAEGNKNIFRELNELDIGTPGLLANDDVLGLHFNDCSQAVEKGTDSLWSDVDSSQTLSHIAQAPRSQA